MHTRRCAPFPYLRYGWTDFTTIWCVVRDPLATLALDPLWPGMGSLKPSMFSDLAWAHPPSLWSLQTLHGPSDPVRVVFGFHGREASCRTHNGLWLTQEALWRSQGRWSSVTQVCLNPVTQVTGLTKVRSFATPVSDKGGPLAAIIDPLACKCTGGPLADKRGQTKWEARWVSQEAL